MCKSCQKLYLSVEARLRVYNVLYIIISVHAGFNKSIHAGSQIYLLPHNKVDNVVILQFMYH